jgi:hypothetical protein
MSMLNAHISKPWLQNGKKQPAKYQRVTKRFAKRLTASVCNANLLSDVRLTSFRGYLPHAMIPHFASLHASYLPSSNSDEQQLKNKSAP